MIDQSTTISQSTRISIARILVFSLILISISACSTEERATLALIPTDRPTTTPEPTPSQTPPSPTAQTAGYSGNYITANSQWTPVEQDIGDATMVLVPSGCFIMGSDEGFGDEQPAHEQCIEEPFWIDKFEVTNARYGSTGCNRSSSNPSQPRNCVDLADANDFCALRGGRLPTEAEWEYAARGVDSLMFPWGNEFSGDNTAYSRNSDNETVAVGSFPEGVSWVGAMDMSGNVWEWTSSAYFDYPYDATDGREDPLNDSRVLRGGAYDLSEFNLRGAERFSINAGSSGLNIGFRCVRDYTG